MAIEWKKVQVKVVESIFNKIIAENFQILYLFVEDMILHLKDPKVSIKI
jgi:hypothetical protein